MNRARCRLTIAVLVCSVANVATVHAQLWSAPPDERFGVVATDTSGWNGPVMPMQGPQFFDAVAVRWWYNYLQDSVRVFPGYHKLYMYWKATLSSTPAQIQADAAAAAAAYPGETIWWSMSNEPNDRGQANQSATDFAAIYFRFHQNLKLGDPNCRIIGPSMLNWDFQSTSVFQTGKSWYEEFRQAWYNNASARAYSEANYGVSFPPQDGFNLHTYDLRGVQGTPWAAEDWRYCRDQILLCYNDLPSYPEVLSKTIWLTEFGALRASSMDDNIILTRQLVGWMREQPFMVRWFWFSIHSDRYWVDTTPPRLELLDEQGQASRVGQLAYELATLPAEVQVDPVNAHYASDPAVAYLRNGYTTATLIQDVPGDGPRFEPLQNSTQATGSMRGRTLEVPEDRLIRKVTFQYTTNYDNTRLRLVMDRINHAGTKSQAWSMGLYGANTGVVELTFAAADRVRSLGIGMMVVGGFTYESPTGEWFGQIRNLVIYSEPDRTPAPGDFDADGDVDQTDFAHLQACLTHPTVAPEEAACLNARFDADEDVDQDDMAVFLQCFSGPSVPADQNCAQ